MAAPEPPDPRVYVDPHFDGGYFVPLSELRALLATQGLRIVSEAEYAELTHREKP